MPARLARWGSRFCLVAGICMLALAAQRFRAYLSARMKMHRIADSVLGTNGIPPAAAVPLLQDAIRMRLRPWPPGEAERRPFLRDSAEDVWMLRLGKCGDGSRLMIQLLTARGIAARRVLLYDGAGVTINAGFEYEDGHRWVYEGAFNSVPTELEYTRAHPAGIRNYFEGDNPVSRHYKTFSYLNLHRLGLSLRVTHPLPEWLELLLETPSLMVMFLALSGGLACLTLRTFLSLTPSS